MTTHHKFTVIGAGIYIAAAGLAWRISGHIDPVQIIIVIGFIWLLGMDAARDERDEETRADVDEALRGLDDVKNHLFGIDTPSEGRHARSDHTPHYKPSPRPRSVA